MKANHPYMPPTVAFNFNAPVVGGIPAATNINILSGNLFNGSILPASTKEQLAASRKLVNQNLEKDSKFVDIFELSRNQDDSNDELFVKKQFVALPDPIFEEYRRLEYKCFMGIFPEIHRAWITIDNKFFIWSYLDGSDFNEYDELDQIIISAGLVKPKANIFKDYVQYLLVLATPIEIVLVAVAFNHPNAVSSPTNNNGTESEKQQQHHSFDSQTGSIYSEMELFPTNYIIPSDNINMLKIVGTKNGRIFMCGKDGCLYELTYEPEEGWFKSKCRKLNHSQSFVGLLVPSFLKFTHDDPIIDIVVDDTRNILYTLSDNMTIEVYDLGEDGDSMKKVVSYSNLLQDMMRKFPLYNCNLNSLKIISIAPISENESKAVHLVAITSKGDRIFFTTGCSQDGIINDRPIGISLLHIKSVSFQATTSNFMNTNNKFIPSGLHKIHECFYKDGVCILADELSNQVDSLVCLSMERKYSEYGIGLNENVTTKQLDNGMTHAIAEIPLYLDPVLVSSQNTLNELSFQHIKPPREFVCLSNNGMHLLIKLRPVDFLQQILQSQSDSLLNSFFTKYSDDEACAMCAMLACAPPAFNNITDHDQQPTLRDEMLIKKAEQAFFQYGGVPRLESQERNITNNTMGGPVSAIDIKYSAQHNGLYLYFSRLMRPLWISPVFNSRARDGEILITSLRYSAKQLKYVQQCLFGIYNFLKLHPQLHEIQSNVKKSIQEKVVDLYNTKKDEEAKRLEQRSIHNLYVLLKRCYQGLIFLYYMDKCKLANFFTSSSNTRISQMATVPFCDLFLTSEGEKMMKEMVRMVVMRRKEVDTAEICEALKDCDEFFDPKDLEEYKALDALEKAKSKHDEVSLQNSLEMFKKIAGHINVLVVCKEFQKLGYYTGAVELALVSAELKDPSNLALEWIKAGKPALGMAGQQAFAARIECYNCALSSLDLTDNEDSPIIDNHNDKQTKFSDMLEKMSKSKDSLFHETLYQWLIEHNRSDKLLSLNTPFIENFLIKQNKHYEELSFYYFNNGRYDKAARVLLKLAETKSTDTNLDGRIKHLTHAINYAKAAQTQDDLLNTLQDKLDVALIQKRVLKQITDTNPDGRDIICAELESTLFDINTLYNKYAEPYDLLESRLCILHCAKYKNHDLIQDLWNELIDISIRENNLESKIVSLGRELGGIYFPLEFICGQLEKRTLDSAGESGWVVRLMRDKVGVKYTNLYNAYHNLFILLSPTKSKVGKDISMFYNQENLPDTKEIMFRILENISKILGDWIGEINTPSDFHYTQTFSLGDIKKDIVEYLSELNTFHNAKTEELKKTFKKISGSI